ncbi:MULTISPECIES: NAD(P)/FAD-dependent oxidoreductase [Deferrisoma]
MPTYDAIVVGAGPAGGAAALMLARTGARVLLVDRSPPPREKTCGDGLLDDAWEELGDLGLTALLGRAAHSVEELRIWSPGGHGVALRVPIRTLSRSTLDRILVEAAAAEGAQVEPARIVAAVPEPPGVRVTAADARTWRARIAVVATGALQALAPRTARPLGRPAPDAVALRVYATGPADLPFAAVTYDRSVLPGYGWVFPLGGRRFNVGCGAFRTRRADAPLHRTLERLCATSPALGELRGRIAWDGPPRAAPIRCGPPARPPVDPGPVVWAGEALGTSYPFTAEGIGPALESGRKAGEAAAGFLAHGARALEAYRRWVRTELARRYASYRVAERWLARPGLCDLLARRAQQSPRLRKLAAGIVAGTTPPRALFSPWGLVRVLLGL